MRKYIEAVLPAVGQDKKQSLLFNKIAVYKNGSDTAFCVSDSYRIHFAFTGGDFADWTYHDPVGTLNARMAKYLYNPNLDLLIPEFVIKPSEEELKLWGSSVWEIMGSTIQPFAGQWVVNQKRVLDAVQSAGLLTDRHIMISSGGVLNPIRISTPNFLAVVMPWRGQP
jgi:hypothetical protein